MTILLYQTDSYLKSFEAQVIGLDDQNYAIILDRTALYPGGGGQPFDLGKLSWDRNSIPIIRSRKMGDDVLHFVNHGSPMPTIGTYVVGELDWDRRYKLMRTHTAMHILCGVIFRDYGASVTGGDMDPLEGRMDFEFETMQKELVQEIEVAINLEVKQNRSVYTSILPRDEAFKIPDLIRTKINLLPVGIPQVRIVDIQGLDLQADGGTHVRSTGEVGPIRVVDYKSKGKINKRIYIALNP